MKKEKLYLRFKRPDGNFPFGRFLCFAFLLISLIAYPTMKGILTRYESKLIKAENAMREEILKTADKCTRIGVKMQYAGADIEHSLLPELRIHASCLEKLSSAYASSFGENSVPVDTALIRKILQSIEKLDENYGTGSPSEESEQALISNLQKLSKLCEYSMSGVFEIFCFHVEI